MTGSSIADLAVLGIACEGPIEPDRIAAIAKALVPEFWQPTACVISAAIARNLAEGTLWRTGNHDTDQHLAISNAGVEHIRTLLLSPTDGVSPSARLAFEGMKFCFLDAADKETAAAVARRYRAALEERLTAHMQRSARCPYGGRYTNTWMRMEQRRLESMIAVLSSAAAEDAASESRTVSGVPR